MFASEHWKIFPDIIATAKSISGGLPLSAVTAREEIVEASHIGGIGGTFCGNPLACVVASKVIEIMERNNFFRKAQKIGEVIQSRFNTMKEKYSMIGDVRGRGAMMAFELVKDSKSKVPTKEETKAIIKEVYKKGVVLLSVGIYGNVIRILVPLVITEEQLKAGLDIIEKSVEKISLESNKNY